MTDTPVSDRDLLIRIDERVHRIRDDTDELTKVVIRGNGRRALMSMVEEHEGEINELKATAKQLCEQLQKPKNSVPPGKKIDLEIAKTRASSERWKYGTKVALGILALITVAAGGGVAGQQIAEATQPQRSVFPAPSVSP